MVRDPGRRPRLLRDTLLVLLGALVGANGMYYARTRGGEAPAPVAATSPPPAQALPVAPSGRMLVKTTPTPEHPQSEDSLAGGPVLAPPVVRATGAGPAALVTPAAGGLLIPVQGIAASQLQDTFNAARSDNRVHDAIDIMAPAGTPVLAVADGTVAKLFDSERGGITLYQFNPERTIAYYYAHLQGYAPGIAEQQAIRRGQLIGYVGSTGNASPDAPHLHFAVFQLGPGQRWWEGTAVNPYPLLGGASPR